MATRSPIDFYLELLADSLIGIVSPHEYHALDPRWYGRRKRLLYFLVNFLRAIVAPVGLDIVRRVPIEAPETMRTRDPDLRNALTMIGPVRLASLRTAVETVIAEQVPGDLVETGVWRGGATIYMKGIIDVLGEQARRVWVADSFRGLPEPDVQRYPIDRINPDYPHPPLGVSADDVRANFRRYGLLDDRVCFLEGWFSDTLPEAPIDRISVLRLDGDMYESTWDVLTNLYSKVSNGGFVIVDDYGLMPACAKAVEDFRRTHEIDDPIAWVDDSCVLWRCTNHVP